MLGKVERGMTSTNTDGQSYSGDLGTLGRAEKTG